MRRQGILLLLILGCVSRLATGGVWWVRVPRRVRRIACTKDCKIRSRPEEFWEPLGGCPRGHPTVCLGLPCMVLNQSIVGLSPLFETTYSTSHEIPNDGSWWIFCLINCIIQPCLHQMANLVKIKPTRTCAKILKVRTYSLLLFSKRNPVAKSLSCLELGK
jgi:hypothetical protein